MVCQREVLRSSRMFGGLHGLRAEEDVANLWTCCIPQTFGVGVLLYNASAWSGAMNTEHRQQAFELLLGWHSIGVCAVSLIWRHLLCAATRSFVK